MNIPENVMLTVPTRSYPISFKKNEKSDPPQPGWTSNNKENLYEIFKQKQQWKMGRFEIQWTTEMHLTKESDRSTFSPNIIEVEYKA